MQGVVKQLCDYLNITQILTGGHNPRGNAICERANQTLGAMIRKLNDQEYRELKHQSRIPICNEHHSSLGYWMRCSHLRKVSPYTTTSIRSGMAFVYTTI
jgi:hypothetical protein